MNVNNIDKTVDIQEKISTVIHLLKVRWAY